MQTIMLSELFCHLPMREAGICYSGAYVVSVLAQAIMGMLATEAAFLIELGCAAAAVAAARSALTYLPPPSSTEEEDAERSWALPWYLLVLCSAFTLVAFLLRQLIADSAVSFSWLGGGVVSLVSLIGCLAFFEKRFDAMALGLASLPLMVSGILLWCWGGSEVVFPVLFLTDAANVAFRIFLLVMVCDRCFRYDVSPLWLFSLVRAAMMAAEGAGLGISLHLSSQGITSATPYIIPAAYAMVVVLVTVTTGMWRTCGAASGPWRVLPKAKGTSTQSEQLRAVMSPNEVVLWKCNRVARLYGLTHREEEVLCCLLQGKARAQIEEDLVLSESTVRTHMRHLYAKLEVHSRNEAVRLAENVE